MHKESGTPVDRRRFLKKSAGVVVGIGACLCGLSACATITGRGNTPKMPPEAFVRTDEGDVVVDLAKVPELAEVGGSAKIVDRDDLKPIIVARIAEASFVTASITCPHRGVEVEYDGEASRFVCASIGHSKFALDGARLGGPARAAIPVFEHTLADGRLTIHGAAA